MKTQKTKYEIKYDSEPTSFSILIHSDDYKKYISQITKELDRQKSLEDKVFESVMKIGQSLKELKDHTENLKIKGKHKLLESFEAKLPIGPHVILKYISIFENPKHGVKNHKENLPNNITSLYELSILDGLHLQTLKEGAEKG